MDKFTPNPHQIAFFDAPEQYVGLFGGVGNGKTLAACLKTLELSTTYPHNLNLVGRLTYRELQDSTREVFMTALEGSSKFPPIYPPEAYKFNKSENSVTFWNKSSVIFRHLDEWEKLLSMNLGSFYIDQAEEVDEDAFLALQGRLRRQNVGPLKGLVTGNPKGHNWVYYKFGMNQANGATNHVHNGDYRMITAPTHANAANLPKNYIDQLLKSYSRDWFNRYVLGGWDVFEGQIFDLTKIFGYEKLPKIVAVFTACDPAISKKKTACNTAFCTLGLAEDSHIYDLETIADHWNFLETLEEAKKIVSRQRPAFLGVEDAGYQSALAEACRRDFPQIQVVNLKADKDKFRRAKSVSHMIAQGLFHTNNKELLNEMTAFEPDAEGKEKKDRVDALVHCLHMIQSYAPIFVKETLPQEQFKGMDSGQMWLKQTLDYAKKQQRGDTGVIEFSPYHTTVDPEFY